jgi:hypothetical protein
MDTDRLALDRDAAMAGRARREVLRNTLREDPLPFGRSGPLVRRTWAAGCRHWLVLFLLSFMVLCGNGTARGASLTASVDRSVVPAGETITLSLVFEGVNANTTPVLPPIQNFRSGPSTGFRREFTFDGTQQVLKSIFQYSLTATQPGDVVIPPISAVVDGVTLTSQPLRLKIVTAAEAANPVNPAAMAAAPAFVRLVVPRTQVYLGEPFSVEVHLYYRNAADPQMQVRADGFTLSPMLKPAQSRTVVGQTQFNLAVFRLTAQAARTGSLKLGPVEGTLTVFTRVDFLGRALDPRSLPLASEVIPVEVMNLPKEGIPEGFNGAIGSYSLAVEAGPTKLSVGDPITVRVRISGNGPLDTLPYPEQTDWRDFNAYPATAKIEPADPLNLSGTKSFEQVIIPQNHEIRSLPPFKFSFFDPQAKKYRTLQGPPIALSIRPSSGPATPPPVLTNANPAAEGPAREDDIIHIRPHLELAAAPSPLLTRPTFLAAQAIPVLLWVALFVRRKRDESLANNPRRRRQREVAQRIRHGLQELRVHSNAGQSDEFFALLFRLLQEQLGERLDLPSSAITESVIDEHLRRRGLPEATLRSLQELFQTCNQARYAPVRDRQELAAIIPKLEGVLQDLQGMT